MKHKIIQISIVVDDSFIDSYGLDDRGYLYKFNSFDYKNPSVPSYWILLCDTPIPQCDNKCLKDHVLEDL